MDTWVVSTLGQLWIKLLWMFMDRFLCGPIFSFPSIFWLLRVMLLWTLVYKYLFESMLSVLLVVYLDLLDYMVILYVTFWGASILFSTVLCHFTFWAMHRVPISPHPHQHLLFSLFFFDSSHPIGCDYIFFT